MVSRRRWLQRAVGGLGAVLLLGLITTVSAQQAGRGSNDFVNPNGKPKQFMAGKPAMYAIWYDSGKWRLRTTTSGILRNFKGKIQVINGTITKVTPYKLEGVPGNDWWVVAPGNKILSFDFKTNLGADGLDLELSFTATQIRFDLYMDNKHMPEIIHVGNLGHNPLVIPFSLPAAPLP